MYGVGAIPIPTNQINHATSEVLPLRARWGPQRCLSRFPYLPNRKSSPRTGIDTPLAFRIHRADIVARLEYILAAG